MEDYMDIWRDVAVIATLTDVSTCTGNARKLNSIFTLVYARSLSITATHLSLFLWDGFTFSALRESFEYRWIIIFCFISVNNPIDNQFESIWLAFSLFLELISLPKINVHQHNTKEFCNQVDMRFLQEYTKSICLGAFSNSTRVWCLLLTEYKINIPIYWILHWIKIYTGAPLLIHPMPHSMANLQK